MKNPIGIAPTFDMPGRKQSNLKYPWRPAAAIAVAYLLCAGTWILISGWAVAIVANGDHEQMRELESIKGIGFVGLTAVLLFFGVVSVLRQQQRQDEERQKINALLAAASKYETLGQFAATLAHDFNNVLTAINSSAEMTEGSHEAERREHVQNIQKSVVHAQKSIAVLMQFARREPASFVRYDLVAAIAGSRELIRQVMGSRFSVRVDLPNAEVLVSGVQELFVQALINLAANARDAMDRSRSP